MQKATKYGFEQKPGTIIEKEAKNYITPRNSTNVCLLLLYYLWQEENKNSAKYGKFQMQLIIFS